VSRLALVMLVSEHRVLQLAGKHPQARLLRRQELRARVRVLLALPTRACMPSTPCHQQHDPPCGRALPLLQVLSMPAACVAERLLLLKELLPECDVARMLELAPG
jgi:hypothetical protein